MNKLDNIFDINKIRETQETAALFGELAANGIHVIAEKNGWKEGSPEKTALHAAAGAVIADITNGNIAAGAITGGTTEYLTKAILKASKGDKAQAQWIALAVGAALSKATGGNEQLGAFIAVNAVRNNLLLERSPELINSIKELDFGMLKDGEFFVIGYGIPVISETLIVCNNEKKDIYSGISINAGLSLFPADLKVAIGELRDNNGNVITDSDIIAGYLKGYSMTMAVSALGGYSESVVNDGYRITMKSMSSNLSVGFSLDYTYHVGALDEVSK